MKAVVWHGIYLPQNPIILHNCDLHTLPAFSLKAQASHSFGTRNFCYLLHHEASGDGSCSNVPSPARGIRDGDHVSGSRVRHLPVGAVHDSQQERQCHAIPAVLCQRRQDGAGRRRSQLPVLPSEQLAGQVAGSGASHRPRHPPEVPPACPQGLRLPRNPRPRKLNTEVQSCRRGSTQ